MMPKHRSTLKIHKRRGLTMMSDRCRNPAHIIPPAQVNTLFLSLRHVFLIPSAVRNPRAIVRMLHRPVLPSQSRSRLTNTGFSRRSESSVFRWTCRLPPPLFSLSLFPLFMCVLECRRFYVLIDCCRCVEFFPFLRRWKSRAGNSSLYPRPFSFTLADESFFFLFLQCIKHVLRLHGPQMKGIEAQPSLFIMKLAVSLLHNHATKWSFHAYMPHGWYFMKEGLERERERGFAHSRGENNAFKESWFSEGLGCYLAA